MILPKKISTHNFYAFLWHAGFLALAKNFIDVDTIIPAMIIESGGEAVHIGIMTAIMLGGASFTQLFFAPYVSNNHLKKKFLLIGINSRIFSLFALGFVLYYSITHQSDGILGMLFLLIAVFSVSGAFTNISYIDVLGKSINQDKRKTFFSAKQITTGSAMLLSAFLAKKVLDFLEYPVNFAFLFFTGASLLLIASGGFWKVKEITPSVLKIYGIKDFARKLKSEISENPALAYFLGFINTQGIIISFLPFVVLYAKETMNAQRHDTGYFLLYKIIGVVTASLLVFLVAKRIKYNVLLYLNVALSFLLVFCTFLINDIYLIRYIFILGGVVYSLYVITMNGLLLEISGNENRAIYTGFTGAGNMLPAVFPLTGGWIIAHWGFGGFFLLIMLIVSSSVFFIRKINCHK
ncbi:MAG: MFS transporter [Prolixibacteraceae bacterium]|nr:MFS transporter [Prolixibacteraceae bacterium]